jgi:hypothetical protein
MNAAFLKLRWLLAIALISTAPFQVEGQQNGNRSIEKESNIKLPEFYGMYAIDAGKTISLKGNRANLSFGPSVEFLLFEKAVVLLMKTPQSTRFRWSVCLRNQKTGRSLGINGWRA